MTRSELAGRVPAAQSIVILDPGVTPVTLAELGAVASLL
jgi:hypothetical protein